MPRADAATNEAANFNKSHGTFITLPDKSRGLVTERYQRGLSNDEVAAAMGRTSEWVRVTLFRIRAQLRECINLKLEQATL